MAVFIPEKIWLHNINHTYILYIINVFSKEHRQEAILDIALSMYYSFSFNCIIMWFS